MTSNALSDGLVRGTLSKMTLTRDPARNRGFTLVELLAAVAIFALLGLLVLPSAFRLNERAREQGEIRRVLSEIRRARATAASKRRPDQLSTDSIRSAGISILTATSYMRFSDFDTAVGGETPDSVVDLTQTETNLTIQAPAVGDQIRFRADGTLLPGAPQQIRFASPSGRVYVVNISLTGLAQVD